MRRGIVVMIWHVFTLRHHVQRLNTRGLLCPIHLRVFTDRKYKLTYPILGLSELRIHTSKWLFIKKKNKYTTVFVVRTPHVNLMTYGLFQQQPDALLTVTLQIKRFVPRPLQLTQHLLYVGEALHLIQRLKRTSTRRHFTRSFHDSHLTRTKNVYGKRSTSIKVLRSVR